MCKCSKKFVRFLLYFSTIIVLFCGIGLLLTHAYKMAALASFNEITQGLNSSIELDPVISIICALILIIVSCVTIFGIMNNIKEIIIFYRAILFFFVIIHLVVSAMLFDQFARVARNREDYKDEMTQHMWQSVFAYLFADYRDLLDSVHIKYKCCGVRGAADWHRIWNNSSAPESCCYPIRTCSLSDAYKVGCVDIIFDKLLHLSWVFTFLHVLILFSEFLAFCLTFSMVRDIKKTEAEGRDYERGPASVSDRGAASVPARGAAPVPDRGAASAPDRGAERGQEGSSRPTRGRTAERGKALLGSVFKQEPESGPEQGTALLGSVFKQGADRRRAQGTAPRQGTEGETDASPKVKHGLRFR
ncbi:tetraspanin-9-like [Agrilus planipennis]|uniref:Tetraspanin-9-like n=1 Tax=Agrilus planipennis TaxID=224129 RepID=A0A1W4XBR0_AGRPL|nr:tetraspanin-9-like [Agrilus planipennis]